MKAILVLFLALNMALAVTASASDKGVTMEGKLNCPYISHKGGTAFLQISITTPAIESPRPRPMNIAVVLDRSGSMADQKKIEYAKQSLYSLIDQLTGEDILSIVIYDDAIQVLRDARYVDDKREIKRLVASVSPRNSTNLGGGMIEGFHQVEKNLGREYVNRVILLSDGLANQGITDPYELNNIARRYRTKSISLTTMGVGLEYNENLMVGLSESGGGNYYFIESPHNLASIMRKELNLLSSLVAQNASVELTLGRNVHVRDVIGCEHQNAGDRYVIPLGDLYSNDRRELTVELEIPEGVGTLTVATGTLRYESDRAPERHHSFSASVHYTRIHAEVEKNRNLEIQAKADIAVSTRKVEQAMKDLDAGRQGEAEKQLKEAASFLSASPAASQSGAGKAMILQQQQQLESYEKTLQDSSENLGRAKKTIQYKNYRTLKNKQ